MKYLKILLLIGSATLFTTYAHANTFNMTPIISYLLSDTASPTLNIQFTEESSINILNPDRGFYDAAYELDINTGDTNRFQWAIDDGFVLVYAPVNLDDYNTTEQLPDELLTTISKNLNDANTTGVKLILRIRYRPDIGGYDPSRDIVMGHLNQLKPILQTYKNIISVVQAGIIGAWGEWHAFTGDYVDTNENYIVNRKEIIDKLVEIFPDKYIQVRTPMHKELLYGSSTYYGEPSNNGQITPDTAFTNDTKAKIGHHNDCFLADEHDMGTYVSDNIEFWQAYVVNDTKYSPVGGETCQVSEYTNCENTIIQMKKFQYSYINHIYHPEIIEGWRDNGCFDEINENIGYRLVAKELNMQQETDMLKLSLSIENKGYASPYINSDVNFMLKNAEHVYTFGNDIDLRTFYAQETKSIKSDLSLAGVESGEYCLYIGIGENYSAIRLSNSNMWEESSKTNKLVCDIILESFFE